MLAAIGLLGSPGPAIAALLAIGKTHGLSNGLKFFWGLQVGLATAAAISTAGLVSLILAVPTARFAMTVIATLYLLYLAWKIGTAPIGSLAEEASVPAGGLPLAGFIVGVTNPKAYIAFASLMAPKVLIEGSLIGDGVLKWILVVVVMVIVDLLWLLAGVALGRASMAPSTERILNIVLAMMIVLAAGLALL